jgi:hypothetical protein
LQGEETIEAKIREYDNALDCAAGFYRELQQLVTTQSNDYSLDVMSNKHAPTFMFRENNFQFSKTNKSKKTVASMSLVERRPQRLSMVSSKTVVL